MNYPDQEYQVAHLVNQMDHGVAAGDLTKALNTHTNIDSTVISLQKSTYSSENIPVIYSTTIDSSSRISPEKIRWLNKTLANLDIITAHHTFAGLLGSMLAKIQRKPIVAREGNNHQKFPLKVRAARAVTGLLADRIVCVSQSVADSYDGFERIVPSSKFEVINNGVDIEEIQSAKAYDWSIHSVAQIDSEASVVGTAGMLVEQKNHETLIKAIERLRHDRSMNVELVIAGAGPREEFLQTLARDLSVKAAVHFLGYLEREKVYKMFHEIDCYAMPSRWEGLSSAALQAMAAGVPCVFSNIPSFRSQFPDSVARFHAVESVEELQTSLSSTLQNDDGIGNKPCRFISVEYSLKHMAKKYESVYLDVLSNGFSSG